MKFRWKTRDGIWHEKTIFDSEEILKFIEWLEYDPNVVIWR